MLIFHTTIVPLFAFRLVDEGDLWMSGRELREST
jgi:hypothetical protein